MKILPDVSVVIPVYNQLDSLKINLRFFNYQKYPFENIEIVVVDDGSDIDVNTALKNDINFNVKYTLRVIRQKNQGRAAARNTGCRNADGEIIIFCDADRFPDEYFIENHVSANQMSNKSVVIGSSWDCYYPLQKLMKMTNEDLPIIKKFSRLPEYYLKISNLYNDNGFTESKLSWITFLVGNSSLRKTMVNKTGGFDNDFIKWGFEHFELGLRLQKNNSVFYNYPAAINYHIPHKRDEGFYVSSIKKSILQLNEKHSDMNCLLLKDFLFGKISLQDFELKFNGDISKNIKDLEPIYYNSLQVKNN